MSSIRILTLYCAFLVAHVSCAIVKNNYLPASTVKVCKQDDSNYTSCLTNAIQDSWMIFVQGVPKLNMPVLDPLEMEVMESNTIKTEHYVGSIILHNLKTYGLAKTKFLSVRPQFKGNRINLDMDIEIPKIFIEGDYKSDGSIDQSFNIGGKGNFNISMIDWTATWSLEGRVEDDKWIVEHFFIDPEVKGMKLYFSDLVNGNEILNEAILEIANQHWSLIFTEFKPIIRNFMDPYSTYLTNLVFSKVAVSQIFS